MFGKSIFQVKSRGKDYISGWSFKQTILWLLTMVKQTIIWLVTMEKKTIIRLVTMESGTNMSVVFD